MSTGLHQRKVIRGFMLSLVCLIDTIFVYKIPVDVVAKSWILVEVQIAILYFSFFGEETAMPEWVAIWVTMDSTIKTGP